MKIIQSNHEMMETIAYLKNILDKNMAERDALQARIASLEAALAKSWAMQYNPEDGVFMRCGVCGEETTPEQFDHDGGQHKPDCLWFEQVKKVQS